MLGRRFFILIVLITNFIALQAGAQVKPTPYSALANDILTLVNNHRAAMGLQPLAFNKTISEAAESHSRNMGAKKIPFGHDGFDSRMNKLSNALKPASAFAENVAYGPTTAEQAVDMWLHSPGHKKNIEGDYNLTGIGIVKGRDGELYFTQIFVNKGR